MFVGLFDGYDLLELLLIGLESCVLFFILKVIVFGFIILNVWFDLLKSVF